MVLGELSADQVDFRLAASRAEPGTPINESAVTAASGIIHTDLEPAVA